MTINGEGVLNAPLKRVEELLEELPVQLELGQPLLKEPIYIREAWKRCKTDQTHIIEIIPRILVLPTMRYHAYNVYSTVYRYIANFKVYDVYMRIGCHQASTSLLSSLADDEASEAAGELLPQVATPLKRHGTRRSWRRLESL